MPEVPDKSPSDAIVQVFQQYYKIASNSIGTRVTLIQDQSIRDHISNLAENPVPAVALIICKLIMVLSDQRKHARMLAEAGYIPILGRFTENDYLPVKLIAKYIQLQSRLNNSMKDAASPSKMEPKRRTKEMVFVLPILDELQQAAISQNTLQKIKGMVSLSFNLNPDKSQVNCVIRCLLHVEPKQIVDQIHKSGIEEVGYVHTNDDGTKETMMFYKDTDVNIEDDLPQYLDENIAVFDPKTALATGGCAQNAGWFSSAKQLLGFW
ncbi:unnamed protein product [Bursaphelenchus okinawaensis]|uniref:Armadillo repeat-containing protein 1 n=1 Tax=Bursaphelenchus okinawaensis TaxID=465554 RepID=A0A811K244_9BILA|nr:unnamed protein product [Bursaphelenchus okinawaensis]CAG9088834.1 unnamed protein product [Bursaphelenchus okinawaensis]